MKKRVFQTIIIFLGIAFIVKLTGDFLRLLKAGQRIKIMEEKILKLEEKKKELSSKYRYYQTPDFIEEEARNKLNMAKPGEIIVILPPNLEGVLNRPQAHTEPPIPNWKKWWNLFF